MVALIGVMVAILLTWLAAFCVTVGVGVLLWRLHGAQAVTLDSWLMAFWLGLAGVVAVLQVWHFWLPVNAWVVWLLAAIGLVGLVWQRHDLWRVMQRGRVHLVTLLAFGFIAAFAVNNAILESKRYDAGLYQIQSVKWTTDYAIVPGLGNLHGRLAFNNSYHLVIAAFDVGGFPNGRGTHLANGLPLLVLTAWGLTGLVAFLAHGDHSAYTVYRALTLPVALRHIFQVSLYSPDNDLLALLVGLVALGLLLRTLTEPTHTARGAWLAALGWLVGVGVAFKLSFAFLGAGIALTVFAVHLLDRQPLRFVVMAALGGLLLVVPWMGRSVVMSGYPLYPSTFAPFPVDWQMIPEVGEQEAEWVRAWARQPGITGHSGEFLTPDLIGWRWLIPWLFDTFTTTPNLFDVTLPLTMALTFVVSLWPYRREVGRGVWILLPIGAALVAWWVVAPSPRFAGAAFWGLAGSLAGLAAHPRRALRQRPATPFVVVTVVVVALMLPFQPRMVFPAEGSVFYEHPQATTGELITPFTIFNEPLDSDQCWDAPLPCAPGNFPTWNLCQREPGNLAAGFATLEGRHSRCDEQPRVNPNPSHTWEYSGAAR
jgi:hypothetical protein